MNFTFHSSQEMKTICFNALKFLTTETKLMRTSALAARFPGYLNTLSAESVISPRIYLATSLSQSQDNEGCLFGESSLFENDSMAFIMSSLPNGIFNCTTLH